MTAASAVPAALLAAAGPLSRDDARDAARRELSNAIYARSDPSLLARALGAVGRLVESLFSAAASAAPGGAVGAVLLGVLLVVLLITLRLRLGPLARTTSAARARTAERPRTATEHRAAAEWAAAAGRYAEALRERLRAIARDLEQRGVIEPRAGRTADELAGEAHTALGGQPLLRDAARAFDEVWYGSRPATAVDYALAVAADRAVSGGGGPQPAAAATARGVFR